MLKTLLLGASFALAIGAAAEAQPSMPPSDTAPPSDSAPPPADATAPSASQAGVDAAMVAKPGMVVKDNAGATVGTVVQAGQTAEGVHAVVVQVDGSPFTLAANTLTPTGDGLVSSMSKAQIKAAAAGR
jgi:hypothetical protein